MWPRRPRKATPPARAEPKPSSSPRSTSTRASAASTSSGRSSSTTSKASCPPGQGARELTEFFAHIDAKLTPADAGNVKVQRSDKEILSLLTKRANTLHLGTANYCWFTDPSRALCLKLAGTPNATKPPAGMCDSARCPQATHHPGHRPAWAEHADKTKTFLGDLGPTRRTEKTRLQAEYDRATRVLTEIDTAASTGEQPCG